MLLRRCFLHIDLEWKVLYVGSAHDAAKDQVLDEVLVGPVVVGLNKFVLSAEAPNIAQLPETDVLGVTVVLVTCSYKEREFVRIGYYVNNEYLHPDYVAAPSAKPETAETTTTLEDTANAPPDASEEAVALPPPPPISIRDVDFSLVQRQILADKPRVTKFPIAWGDLPTLTQSIVAPQKTDGGTPSTAATEMEAE